MTTAAGLRGAVAWVGGLGEGVASPWGLGHPTRGSAAVRS